MTLVPPDDVERPLVIHGEALETMRRLPDGCVNLVLVDPPYFRVKGDAWDRQWSSAAEFLGWMGTLADEWRRLLAPNGSLYVFASPQMAARVEMVIRERFEVIGTPVWLKDAGWHKKADIPTLRTYFPATERIIFAEQLGADSMAMGESGYEAECERLRGFVFEPLRAYICGEFERAGMLNTAGKIAANVACGFSASAGGMASRHYFSRSQWWLPTEEHYAALADLLGPGYLRREYEDLRRPFSVSAEVPYTDVWTYPTVAHYPGKHPCEKPREMIADIIRASSRPGDLVLDCFLGSGVTGEQAVTLGRRFVGIEMGDYVHAARRRIANAVSTPEATAEANKHVEPGGQLGLL